jgi:predicted ATP-grasp superfamily ATP-dependent carboligase
MRPATLLFDAAFYGTLAAVRSLGRAGVPVAVGDSVRVAPAFFSRYATRRVHSPPASDGPRFLKWLQGFVDGERYVVYPTSDELVFLLSAHRDELGDRLALYQPDLPTALRILDKRRLLDAARAAGFDAPDTWFPETGAEVERAAREADDALMIKPRTQAFLKNHRKGAVVPRGVASVRAAYEQFVREHTYGEPLVSTMPELTRPMLQRFHAEAVDRIFSVSGFRDREGEHVALLGAVKVLQRPRRLGIGLCFEAADVPRDVADRVRRLLAELSYFGVFEIEFIRTNGGRLSVIDMNPRFYNQMALDIARGLDLPRLAYAAALGDRDEVARLVEQAGAADGDRAFCNRMGLRVLVGAQRLFGRMSSADAERWQSWVQAQERDGALVDSVAAEDDPRPRVVDAVGQLYGCVRHPRAFLRMIALDR